MNRKLLAALRLRLARYGAPTVAAEAKVSISTVTTIRGGCVQDPATSTVEKLTAALDRLEARGTVPTRQAKAAAATKAKSGEMQARPRDKPPWRSRPAPALGRVARPMAEPKLTLSLYGPTDILAPLVNPIAREVRGRLADLIDGKRLSAADITISATAVRDAGESTQLVLEPWRPWPGPLPLPGHADTAVATSADSPAQPPADAPAARASAPITTHSFHCFHCPAQGGPFDTIEEAKAAANKHQTECPDDLARLRPEVPAEDCPSAKAWRRVVGYCRGLGMQEGNFPGGSLNTLEGLPPSLDDVLRFIGTLFSTVRTAEDVSPGQRERAEDWRAVFLLCRNLGMAGVDKPGIALVTDFIKRLHEHRANHPFAYANECNRRDLAQMLGCTDDAANIRARVMGLLEAEGAIPNLQATIKDLRADLDCQTILANQYKGLHAQGKIGVDISLAQTRRRRDAAVAEAEGLKAELAEVRAEAESLKTDLMQAKSPRILAALAAAEAELADAKNALEAARQEGRNEGIREGVSRCRSRGADHRLNGLPARAEACDELSVILADCIRPLPPSAVEKAALNGR